MGNENEDVSISNQHARVPGPSAPPADELRAWANGQLGKTQRLADLRYVAELPRSDIGKVLKRQLREQYAAEG